MISSPDILNIARSRFEESKILRDNNKPEGAVYLAGYAIELMLKRRVVHLLEWDGYPQSPKEFEKKTSFKTHNLDLLLELSGLEKKVKADTGIYAKWLIAGTWSSEGRYRLIGTVTDTEAHDMIEATRNILNFIAQETTS